MTHDLASIISNELNIPRKSVNATIKLLDDGSTIPFISRYRKEMTGSLDEVAVRAIQIRINSIRELIKRKEYIISTLADNGVLNPDLEKRIESTLDAAELEDIYMPFKPRRRTRASVARERGLEPLAKIIMAQNSSGIARQAARFVGKDVDSVEAAVIGAQDIIAEWVSESEKARSMVRARYQRTATIASKVIAGKETEGHNYRNYFAFSEPLRTCSSHRYLALRRGESEGILKVSISIDDDEMIDRLGRLFVKAGSSAECSEIIRVAVKDGYRRLLRPSIESEISATVKERSDTSAIDMFAENVKQLLLASPLLHKRVMAIDPGFRTGCKVVCLDEQGNLLAHDVIFPCAPTNDFHGASYIVCSMVDTFHIDAIAVGSGTAGRETERFLQSLRFSRKVQIFMVNEDGASVYSASEIAREEFPDQDVTVRGAVSIGRRLIDPLAELVKIEPKSIGVGQYQHDVDQTRLKDALDFTVSSCVNMVGVNVNTASRSLLGYVSGIGPSLARNIVEYRTANGDFTSREQLLDVPRMGEKSYQQCAGFLRIPHASNPLDNTGIHPESYPLVESIAADMGRSVSQLISNPRLLKDIETARYVTKQIGLPTINDVISELEKPGRDPRESAEQIQFDDSIRTIRDIAAGMEIVGKVNNITSFGVFVDLGIKENGLIHISQLSDRFVASPADIVSIGQQLRVRVMEVDYDRGRIALTLKDVTAL